MLLRPDGSLLVQTALSMSRLSQDELSPEAAEITRLVRLTLGLVSSVLLAVRIKALRRDGPPVQVVRTSRRDEKTSPPPERGYRMICLFRRQIGNPGRNHASR